MNIFRVMCLVGSLAKTYSQSEEQHVVLLYVLSEVWRTRESATVFLYNNKWQHFRHRNYEKK